MARAQFWQADRFCFAVSGRRAAGFLSGAAAGGIRLYHIRCAPNGYRAHAAGRDYAALAALAARGGWHFTVLRRRGMGALLEWGARRCGIPVGAVVFLLLLRFFSSFVWSLDLAVLDASAQPAARALLARYQLWEGAQVSESKLRGVQQALLQQADQFGWVSLNFTGGCLYLEATEAQKQPIAAAAEATALYATDNAMVLSVDVKSGFAAIAPGQVVAKGQLLAWAEKWNRSGKVVTQAASGQVRGRVVKTYTATVPLNITAPRLTGARVTTDTLYLLGRVFAPDAAGAEHPYPDAACQTEWLPLRLGRLALPLSLCRRTYWERAEETQAITRAAANQLAIRACRLQLLAEYPDAVIESQENTLAEEPTASLCTATITFCANIARQEPNHTPLPPYVEQ
ncbi:MAG: sporulation protein YqfD [Gemmiger sp.]|nr:sporulation protein YqfD [Gemmiger sp.]